jgi:NMD protein affecting ribosome stability and mRNA decay
MKETTTPPMYVFDHFCVDCGVGIDPHQAKISEQKTFKSRALGDSRNRDGFTLCRRCLDRETRSARVREKKAQRCSDALLQNV